MNATTPLWPQIHLALLGELSGQRALDEATALYATDHWFSYRNFARTAEHVAHRLTQIGLREVRVDPIPAEARTRYSGWVTAPAWDITRGSLTIVSPTRRCIADWKQVPHHVIMRSQAAHGTLPLVAWNGEEGVDLSGKIAFTHLRPAEAQHRIKALGGLGIVSDFLPALPSVRSKDTAMDHVLWEQVCFRPNPGGMWGFMIAPQVGLWLDELLRHGPVTAEVDLDGRVYDGVTHAIDALLPGDDPDAPELLLVAHLYEPGANDNASGAGLTLEILRAIHALRQRGDLPLRRGIRALLAYEGRGTMAWLHRHEPDSRRLIAGLNLDEIGVDQTIGQSTAHLFLPPYSNPSFVGELLVSLARQLLDAQVKWKPVADRADIILDTRFSDPSINVPTPCMIQYPAWTYHTSKDTPEVLSPRVLEQFGVLSAMYLLRLANLGPGDAGELDAMLSEDAQAQRAALPVGETTRLALLRERLLAKQRELARYGVTALPRLAGIIDDLPHATPAAGEFAALVPRRLTLAAPGGTQVADILPDHQRLAFRQNLLDHGLDLVFHHFFYWADGSRSIEDICLRIEDELQQPGRSDSIPRTTTSKLTHDLGASLDRPAVLRMYEQLVEAQMMSLSRRP
jgi:hypothetical protein